MEIIKLNYNKSKPVENYQQIESEVELLKDFIVHGRFLGNHPKAYCLHHAQVNPDHYNFFVVHPDQVIGENPMFATRVIINPSWTPITNQPKLDIYDFLKAYKISPQEYSNMERKRSAKIKLEYDAMVKDWPRIPMLEACMSFPYKHNIQVPRYPTIKVKYQNEKMEVIEETCLDTKAQIFQHEVGHAEGKNIYYDKPKE